MKISNKKIKSGIFQFNFIPENKKGGEEIIYLYWFAIILVIAFGIFLMVYYFYGTPYDIRKLESRILMNQISDCVSYGGKINSNLVLGGTFSLNQENFLETCHLNFNSSEWDSDQFYAEVNFYKIDNLENSAFMINKGNSDWKANCEIQEEKEYKKLAQCTEGSFYSIDDDNNQYIIKILTIVRKSEKNVKL